MKKRILALLLAVCVACSMLILPASASGSNTAVQTAVTLGGLTSDQTANLAAPLTRGALTKLMVAFSAYRESAKTQGSTGTLFSDVGSGSANAPYVRIAVQQGWISGYTDGSFRPDNAVTLEEACTAVLKLLGYDVTTLSGTFPAAQLNKANELGLRDNLTKTQGEGMTLEDGAVLLYNALTATTAEGKVYASSLGFTVNNGVVDVSSILLSNVKGPFVAGLGTQLPFAPTAVYRNDTVTTDATLNAYDVYYYNETARTVWIYTRKAAGRITAVSPSANAPTSVTVAGTEYTIASSSVAAQLSALNGGGVGQVVTLLLGMNDEAVSVLTGDAANEVFYGVVQTTSRSLVENSGPDVQQTVAVACTDGVTRSVNVDKQFNYPAGKLVAITVDENGENIQSLETKSTSGTVNAEGTALDNTALASNVEILDTTSEGLAGAVRPSRLSGVTLSGTDVKYYTTNEKGEIDRLILSDVTGDLWEYAALDGIQAATDYAGSKIDEKINEKVSSSSSTSSSLAGMTTTTEDDDQKAKQTALDVRNIMLPSTSDVLYGLVDGSIVSTTWNQLTGSTDRLASYVLKKVGDNVGGVAGNIIDYFASGANYVCYVNGKQVTYTTSVKYPVIAGGVAIGKSADGKKVNAMVQLSPVVVDKLGAGWVMKGDTRYETADDIQVYLWNQGTYYKVSLADLNTQDYKLIGWYDNQGHSAGNKIRLLVAVRTN
ncbi:S-layer homology domain-containing protein [Faecalibacterium sp. OF04-11AC]|uniref:S-layer homology domain-containing protein n=1 Tax=Faecalibacterium sp. OF04-11AC TaxID=2293109 RepID=UPI000E86AF17|nr:S-layer homology domain-containing protein [Faecalibacterium sp. OF04-11AC]RGF79025.1 S-layer homology domain-containing protein [Faecalibacterium sp. OF04-11AC]